MRLTNRLGNPCNDDSENNNGPITIQFVDGPIGTSIDHEQQIAPEHSESEHVTQEFDGLTNIGNYNPDNITIRIIRVNNKDPIQDNSERNDTNHLTIKDHDYGFANTK